MSYTYRDGSGSPRTAAADSVSGEDVPRFKPQHGVAGAAVDASTANPFPVTMPGVTSGAPLPASLPGVTAAAPLPVREPVRGAAIGKNGAALTPGTSNTVVAAANASRTCIEVSNGSASGIWLAFGATAAVNTGTYLPAKATGYWYTTAAVNMVLETGGTGEAKVGYTEW